MEALNGGLFANDLLKGSIVELDEWQALDDAALDSVERSLHEIVDRFPITQRPNESQTEDDLIWPVLARLGWTSNLRQQNLTPRGVDDVPDGLLFADEDAKDRANGFAEEWKRYEFGLAMVESKRWALSLDGRSDRQARTAPSTQMLRYLRRVDDLTTGRLRWGILTNGARWRLYYQGARSVSEEFCEIDLAAVLNVRGHNDGLFALAAADRRHWLKVFVLLFRREAFIPGATARRTFHRRALDEGRFYEQRRRLGPFGPGIRSRLSGTCPRYRGGRAAGAVTRCPRCDADASLPPALHPVRRRSRVAARPRPTIRRLRTAHEGARRRPAPQGSQ